MTGEMFEPLGVGLGKLLRENKFSVPNHQRDYSWKEEHVRQLFADILMQRNAVTRTILLV
jgi:uncharacterized protein with ParB-like and HNH nuclease domain